MNYDYDKAAQWAEANEWKEELRQQKIPDEPVWTSLVKHPRHEGAWILKIQIFKDGDCYLRREGKTGHDDYELSRHGSLQKALDFAREEEIKALSQFIK